MQEITLHDTLPRVFRGRTDLHSDIWHQEVILQRGHTYLVEAASGTGKSSLCAFLYGQRLDYDGTIYFDGQDTRPYPVSQWVEQRTRHISLLFQELRLFPELTAWENVQVKNALTHFKDDKTLQGWFERLGIADKIQTPCRLLSFGQQQRVALIRALAMPFDILLADEPTSHVDDDNAAIMATLVAEEAHKQNATVLITSIGKHMPLSYDYTFRL